MTGMNRWNEPILSQTQTKRQHFVPRHYLKPFSRGDGTIRVVDFQEERDYATSLTNAAVQSRFYDVVRDGQDYSAEDWLADLENNAASALRRLLDNPSSIASFTDEDEDALSRFVAALIFRTPSKRQEIDRHLGEVFSQIERTLKGQFVHQHGEAEGLAEYEQWQAKPFHEKYGEHESPQPADTTNSLLGEVQGFANLLRAAPWRIGSVIGSLRLYTSDNPVSRFLRPIRPSWESEAFSSFDYFLPLSPNILLKIDRRHDSLNSKEDADLRGARRKRDFSEWEVSMARHIVSCDATRYLYGDGTLVSKDCAVSCLSRVEMTTRRFAEKYLGYYPALMPSPY